VAFRIVRLQYLLCHQHLVIFDKGFQTGRRKAMIAIACAGGIGRGGSGAGAVISPAAS
jgi:hypothetical protein